MNQGSARKSTDPVVGIPADYPKMLYKGDPVYTDSEQIKQDLQTRRLLTMIVPDVETETMRREQGWTDLFKLMAPRPVLTLPKTTEAKVDVHQPDKPKRKYTRRQPVVTGDNPK